MTILCSDDCASVEVEFRSERYAVHCLLGLVVKGDFLFSCDDAGEELAFDVDPCVFRHKKLMQIPCEPCFVERVGHKVP